MKNRKIFLMAFLLICIFANSYLYAQNKKHFYFNFNINQEYKDNIYRNINTTKINSLKFRSSILMGFKFNFNQIETKFNISYENRYQKYFNASQLNRIENYLRIWAQHLTSNKNSIYINNISKLRTYSNDSIFNYFRNIFSIYDRYNLNDKINLFAGLFYWIKNYYNASLLQKYESQRPFIKFIYQISSTTFLGVKTELQWHTGNLYAFYRFKMPYNDLSGLRYSFDVFANKIFSSHFIGNISYKFESDVPSVTNSQFENVNIDNNIDNINNNFHGDEDTQDLLINDPDFDYIKNQITLSLLYKLNSHFSIYDFNIIQLKSFNNWFLTKVSDKTRNDVFVYSSFILKYMFNHSLKFSFYFNLENKSSNLPIFKYHRNTIGVGIHYKF